MEESKRNKKEILEKAQSKKVYVGEMEKQKIDKSNWIAVIATGIVALDEKFENLFYFED